MGVGVGLVNNCDICDLSLKDKTNNDPKTRIVITISFIGTLYTMAYLGTPLLQQAANYGVKQSPQINFTPLYNAAVNYGVTNSPSGSISNTGASTVNNSTSSAPQSQPQQPQGPSQDEINKAIDEAYSGSMDYLNQAEGALRSDLPNVLQEAQNAYNTNAKMLQDQKDKAFNTFGEQTNQAGQRYEDALAASRRLYNELRNGYTQRFGGASSAGQAAGEISAVEQQRQQGQNQRQYGDVIRQIDMQRQDVENNFNTGLLQLEQQKQAAINQANRDFQQKLLDINSKRAELGQNKAQARLAALQDLRNKVFQIQLQNQQFQQTLEAQRQQAHAQLGNYANQVSGALTNASNASTAFNQSTTTNPQSNLQANSTSSTSASPYVGTIQPKKDDPFGLNLYQSAVNYGM